MCQWVASYIQFGTFSELTKQAKAVDITTSAVRRTNLNFTTRLTNLFTRNAAYTRLSLG